MSETTPVVPVHQPALEHGLQSAAKPVFSFESEVDSDDSSETSSVASSSLKGRRPSAYLPVAPATVERKASTDTNTVTIINTFINKSMITSEGELIRQQGNNFLSISIYKVFVCSLCLVCTLWVLKCV